MNQSKETTVNPYEQVFEDAWKKLESSPKFSILKKLGTPISKSLAPIPFPYGREGKTEYNFNTP